MNLFEQYGIKEVADVTIYSIHKKTDGSGDVYYMPALYLDTLKVSTVEKTGESTWAQGGLGNARLVNWDYGKTINVTLEDALCTPASLGLCWNGILSADWKNAHVDYNSDVCVCRNPLVRLSRMEKAIYPSGDRKTVSRLLPQTPDDSKSIDDLELLRISSIVDGTKINGIGMVGSKTYNWKMAIESAVKSIAVVPDRFFDIKGRSYSIDWNRKISADSLPSYYNENYKSAVIYKINTTSNFVTPPIAEIIFDNEMQNRCGEEKAVKIAITPEGETTMYHKKGTINKKIYDVLSLTEQNNYTEIYTKYELQGNHPGYKKFLTYEELNTFVDDSTAKGWYEGVEGYEIYEFSGTDEEITATDYNALSDIMKQTYEPTEIVVKVGTYNIYDWLANQNFLFEKGVIIGDISDDFIEPETVADLTSGKVHFVLCPKDRTITITESTTEISLRIFTLNTYGIEKYLNNDAGNLVHDTLAQRALTKYLQNHATTNMFNFEGRPVGTEDNVQVPNNGSIDYIENEFDSISKITAELDLQKGDYLAIIIDANNNYHALVGEIDDSEISTTYEDAIAQSAVTWYKPSTDVNLTQFQGIDMWLRFESINEMIYFLITKYEQDIQEIRSVLICPKDETPDGNWDVNRNRTALHVSTAKEDKKEEGALWAYVNPRTMQPYSDDYWFHQGDPYYIKSLTLAQDGKKIKGNQIIVKADEWPGMYMIVGETRIRNRDTGEDERVQLKFPQCKVKADQTLTLSADGDPTTFTINLEVAKPRNGHMMEITAYEIATKMTEGENGCYYAIDGSSRVVTE